MPRSLRCLVGKHDWRLERAVFGYKIVEHCARPGCPKKRVMYAEVR